MGDQQHLINVAGNNVRELVAAVLRVRPPHHEFMTKWARKMLNEVVSDAASR